MDYDTDFEDDYCYTSLGAIHFKHHSGNKAKLIFLHGLGGTTQVWERLMGIMPADIDVYLVDLLGHGGSDAPDVDYTISVQFQVLREFIAIQNNGDSYIFGNSYGGWVAAYYASQPCTSKGIILEDAAGLKENFDEINGSNQIDFYRKSMLKQLLEINNNKEYVIKSILYNNFDEDRLTTEMLSEINTRALILWGAQDALISPKYADIFRKKIKNSEMVIIDGAGHEPHYEQPEKTMEELLKFIGYAEGK
jgi:pimeloyl-ACP methyl ester carboxylesterase